MYDRFETLICNDSLRQEMGRASRERAITEYSPKAIAEKYNLLWSELTKTDKHVSASKKTISFDRPAYFNHFKHFASAELDKNARITRSTFSRLSLDSVISLSAAVGSCRQ